MTHAIDRRSVTIGRVRTAPPPPDDGPNEEQPTSGPTKKSEELADKPKRVMITGPAPTAGGTSARAVGTQPSLASAAPDRDQSFAGATPSAAAPATVPGKICATPLEAALFAQYGATVPTNAKVNVDTLRHLLNRTTFGPRLADRGRVKKIGVNAWIAEQLHPKSIPDPHATTIAATYPLGAASIASVRKRVQLYSWDASFQCGKRALAYQLFSSRQLLEIVVDVWSNILNVTTPSEKPWDSAPDWRMRVIRQHAMGSFESMLVAAMRHPAMLSYLDNAYSTKHSVNENLGRELLELHTVGVSSGYTETDVRNSAYILSGRSINWETGQFVYQADWHWTGRVKVLGFSHANTTGSGGLAVGDSYLKYLAQHPKTAEAIARKFAVRFVSDTPPTSLVNRMARAFIAAKAQVLPMLDTMFRSTEFWRDKKSKTRRPLEDLVGTARNLDILPGSKLDTAMSGLYWRLDNLGHTPLAWQPPNGYPDVDAAWLSASGLIQRWNSHRALTNGWGKEDGYLAPTDDLNERWKARAGETYAMWFARLADRLIWSPLTGAQKNALLAYIQTGRTDVTIKLTDIPKDWEAWHTTFLCSLIPAPTQTGSLLSRDTARLGHRG